METSQLERQAEVDNPHLTGESDDNHLQTYPFMVFDWLIGAGTERGGW